MSSQLTVYKASAGSGKTFTLAREYMTLVIENPAAYRTILAVTFTNKATEEMKIRILGKLYEIAHSLPNAADYMAQIQQALPHLSAEQIRANAATALHLLIHNYNYFRVETIDTFFQSVLRNLARELDLTANLRIELNDYQIEQQAVDELIEGLEDTDRLLFWIMDYIKENIDDDKNWNVISQIKDFGKNIFKDYYKANSDKLNELMEQEGFFKDFIDRLRQKRNQSVEKLKEIAAAFFDALEEEGYSAEDLNMKKKGIWSYFNKLRNGKCSDEDLVNATFQKCKTSPEAWLKKSDLKNNSPIFGYVESILYPILLYAEDNRPAVAHTLKSTDLTIKHLNQLRLLGSIDKKVREMNRDANRFLLSDTQTLLHSLIQDSDSPFIFEKIGTQLDHVMIDEFQDTSTVQWKNFKVLLEETMSRENAGNLIVGDVKQSIYRWRSGDWRLLNNINSEFTRSEERLNIQSLDTNYRSNRNIVDFNNAFFTEAVGAEAEALKEGVPEETQQLLNAYSDVCQKVPNKHLMYNGHVGIKLMGGEDVETRMMAETLAIVDQLVEKGVACNKIAILVRNNKTIQETAEYFMNHSDYPLVSDEAFRLDASQAVCTLVKALYLLVHPTDDIAAATLQKFANTYLEGKNLAEQLRTNRTEYLEIPLFDLVEKLFSELHLGEIEDMKKQSAYLCAFYDKLSKFVNDQSSDIDAFLKEWDKNIHEKSIHSDSDGGIRFLTIHKSKGLEYDNVIMPFCDWQLEKTDAIWCIPKYPPYNELPLVPIDFSAKQMKQSIYEADYHHEHLQNVVDNLNLLYVAFTRAGHNLFVLGKRASSTGTNTRSYIIEKVLDKVEQNLQQDNCPILLEGYGSDAKTDDVTFSYGDIYVPEKKAKPADSKKTNVLEAPATPQQVEISVTPDMPEFRQSNKSRDFIEGDEEEEQQKYYIKMGTVLHNLFSTIHTEEDIEGALRQLEIDGILYDSNLTPKKLEDMLRRRLESEKVKDWFSKKWTILNECSILCLEDGKLVEYRPDRVLHQQSRNIVIDFKFGRQKEEHHEQVRGYMKLLKEMGYHNVKGYLWYVYPNKVIEVKI